MTIKDPISGYETTSKITVLSTIKSNDISKIVKDGRKFKATFLNNEGEALANRTVIFKLDSKYYKVKTNSEGVAKLSLKSLKKGTYTITSYNKDGLKQKNTIQVLKNSKTRIKAKDYTFYEGNKAIIKVSLYNQLNYTVGAKKVIKFVIDGVTYTKKTHSDGAAYLKLPLLRNGVHKVKYYFVGSKHHKASKAKSKITILFNESLKRDKNSIKFGYWVLDTDMKKVDLNALSQKGTTDLFLNEKSIRRWGRSGVKQWIKKANDSGIRVHIWIRTFSHDEIWTNPVKRGSANMALFKKIIKRAKSYTNIKGVYGIHFDYLRYPGNAYRTKGGTKALNTFVKKSTKELHSHKPGIIVSASLMPEKTSSYYYGQDYSVISKHMDAVLPMLYKGNYRASTKWIKTTTEWYVKNSKGAKVWSGIQTYKSDNKPKLLSKNALKTDARSALKGHADGVILFRYGYANSMDFYSLKTDD